MVNRDIPWWRRLASRLFKKQSVPVEAAPVDAEPAAADVADRRATPRFPCSLETACKPAMWADDKLWDGRIKDISLGGMGLLVKRRFEPGTLLRVDVSQSIPD